ncbi:MAG: hypothetical protein Phog2KO_32940 [Phototrophicaceae bacterium]
MQNKSLRNLIFVFIAVFVLSFVALAQFSTNMIVSNNDSLIVDNNGDQLADPNDVIQYTVVVANCGDGTAENVGYQSQIDSNTQLNPDSVVVNDLETIDSSLCPQIADTSTNNDTPVEETPVPTIAPVIVDADAVDDAFNVTNGATNTENVLANDLGTNARVLSFGDSIANVGDTPADGSNVLSLPAGAGTIDITIDANGDLIITSNGSTGTGTVTIFYEIEAENGTTNIGQISITYGDFPTATDDSLATLGAGNEYATDISVTLNVPAGTGLLANDTLGNPAGTMTFWGGGDASATVTLTPASSTPLAGGTLSVNADGSFDLVTPTIAGVYTFSYILDNGLGTSQGSVEIYVNAPADAIDDAISVTNGGTNTGNIITNDLGTAPLTVLSFGDSVATVGTFPADGATVGSFPAPGGGTLDVTIDSNGDLSVTANGTTGTGTVTIYYEIEAGNATTDIAEIAITFGDFPTAVDDSLATLGAGNEYSVNTGSTLIIGAGMGLLNNDTLGNPAGTLTLWGGGDASATVTLTPASSTPFAGGTLTVGADGSFTVNTPTTTGTYSFNYILDNGLGTSQGSVEIYVVAPPVAVVDSFTVTLGTVDNSNNVVTNDDSGAPSAVVDFYADTGDIGGASQVASPNTYTHPTGNFTAVITSVGDLTVDATGGTVTSGTYTFDYQITNSSGSSVATVTIIIAERPITEDDAFTLIVGNNLASDVTADNGSGADDAGTPAFTSLTFGDGDLGGTVTSNAGGASVALAGGTLSLSNAGAITLNGATTAGTFSFDYQLTNANGTSNVSTVTIEIQEAPTAEDDTLTATLNIVNNYPASTLFNDNGSGADDLGEPNATIASFGGGSLAGDASSNLAGATVAFAGGTLTVNADGSVVVDSPTATGTFTVDYRLTNSAGSSDATVTINVTSAPTAQDDAYTFLTGANQNIVAGAGLFVDNGSGVDTLGTPTATLISFGGGNLGGTVTTNTVGASVALAGGSLTVNADGSWSLTGQPFTAGTYSFDYRLSNSQGISDATVTFTIQEAPTAEDDALTATLNIVNNYPASTLFNDNGSGADNLGEPNATIASFGGGSLGGAVTDNASGATVAFAGGTLTVNADGSVVVDSPTTTGTVTFDYRLTNVAGSSDATITITLNAIPDGVDDSSATVLAETSAPNDNAFHLPMNSASTGVVNVYNDNNFGADNLGVPSAPSDAPADAINTVLLNGVADAGTGTIGGGAFTIGTTGSLEITTAGLVNLTPPTGFIGTIEFDYTLANSVGTDATPATVTYAFGARSACVADSYDATGNIGIDTTNGTNQSVLFNDTGDGFTLSAVQGAAGNIATDTATANAGTVNMTANGEFTYTPPTGFTGNDTFTYTINNGFNQASQCTVTITVSDMVYFMDSSASAGGNGTLARPYQSIAEHNGASPIANSSLFIKDNSSAYAGNLTLVSGQRVIGEGSTGTLFGAGSLTSITLAPLSVTMPYSTNGTATSWAQITNSLGNGITVNANNTISGIDVGNTEGYGLADSGASVGTLTVTEMQIIGEGGIISLANGGTLNADFTTLSTSLTGTNEDGINLQAVDGNLSATTTTISGVDGDGIQIDNSAGGGNFNFGTLDVTTTNGIAVRGANNNQQIISSNNCTLLATGFAVINLHAIDLALTCDIVRSTNSNGYGIYIERVDNGTLTVTNETSITIANTSTNDGIRIDDTNLVSILGTTTVTNNGSGDGISLAEGVGSLTLTNAGITAVDGNALISASYPQINLIYGGGGLTASNGACLNVSNFVGTTTLNIDVESCTATNSPDYGIRAENVNGTLLRVHNQTNISTTGGTQDSIYINNASTSLIDISDDSTLTINNRVDNGIRISNTTSPNINFGTATINNPNADTQPAISLFNVSSTVDFDELNANQGGFGIGETYTVNVPNDNGGLGDVIYANNVTALTLNGGTLSNTGDDGIDFRNSGALTLNNVMISLIDGRNRSNGIQSYNSDSVTMTDGSINDFAGTGVISGGAEPWGAFIYHDNTYTGASSTNIFDSVDFNGGTGTNGNAIIFWNEDNISSSLIIRNGSTFINTDELSIWSLNNGSGTTSTTITNNVFGTPLANGSTGVYISDAPASTGVVEFNINNNIFDDIGDNTGGAILISLLDGADARTQTNQINNNTITEVDGSPAQAGIFINMAETSGLNLEANNNIITGFSEYALLLFTSGWTSGEIDLSMSNNTLSTIGTEPAFEVSDAGNMGSTGNIQILFDDVTINAPNGIAAEVETSSSHIDWVTTNSIFSASSTPNIFVDVQDIGTICLDFNDDGGGQNTTTNGFIFLETSGTLLLENGTTAGDVIADNPGMNNGVPTVVGASQADCINATP